MESQLLSACSRRLTSFVGTSLLALAPVALASAGTAQVLETPGHPMPGFTRIVGAFKVSVGPTRILAREARSAMVHQFSSGTLALTCGNSMVSTNIRSEDGLGQSWKRQSQYLGYLNTLERAGTAKLFVLDYDLRAVAGQPGRYAVTRFESSDEGLSLQSLPDGSVQLPTTTFDPTSLHWVNDLVELDDGALVAAVMSLSAPPNTNNPWFTSLIRSDDAGVSWDFVSVALSQGTIQDPTGALTEHGWPLYWASEPALVALDDQRLLCVARSANDERPGLPLTQIGPASDTYHDLGSTLRGDELAPGLIAGIDANEYYVPGPPNAPLVMATSSDGGTTWSPGSPLDGPRGVFPRLAVDDNGLVALTYGGLSGVPRHGNAIAFSADGGVTWSPEVNVGPFLTTGYTQVVSLGPGHFVVFFDATPPQPWTKDQRWWVGQVDVVVEPAVVGPPYGTTAR